MTKEELDKLILELRQLLSKFDISQLCFKAFLCINHPPSEITSLFKQCSYLINLALNTPAIDDTEPLTESNWKKLLVISEKIFHYYISLYFSNADNFLSEEDHNKAGIVMFTYLHGLCNDSYLSAEQLIEDIKISYVLFDKEISDETGLNTDKIIAISWKITEILQAYLNPVNDLIQAHEQFKKLSKKGGNLQADIRQSIQGLKRESFSVNEIFKITKNDLIKHFSLQDIDNYLSLFSCNRATGIDSEIKVYPNELESKPLIKIKEDTYCLVSGKHLFSSVRDTLESILMQDSGLKERFDKRKGMLLEENTFKHFQNLLGKTTKYFKSVFETPDSNNEHDIVIIYKRTLLIIECKTTKIQKHFRDVEKAYNRIKRGFQDSIQGAFEQAKKLKKLILSQTKTNLYDKTGGLLFEIYRDSIDNIECICLTKESAGFLATNLSFLLKKDDDEDYPYCLNFNDLIQLSEFKNVLGISPTKFINYIRDRKKLHGKVESDDELDFWGYYLTYGNFEVLIKEERSTILDNSYSNIFNNAYLQQTHPEQYKNIIDKFTKVGRNDSCPCGSGIKFKKCCRK